MTNSSSLAVFCLFATVAACASPETGSDSSIADTNPAASGQSGTVKRDFAPVYSPDGTRIAFYSYRHPGDNGDVYVLDRSTGESVQVTSDSTFDLEPRWSADGGELAYTVSADMRVLQTAFVDLDGNSTRSVVDGGIATWSGDGGSIAVNSRGEHGFVPEMVSLGTGRRKIVDAPKGIGYLGPWTGDLQSALYARSAGEETKVRDLYRFNVETGESLRLTEGLDVQAKAWSSDYSRICVVGESAGQTDLYIVDASGGEPEKLTDTPETEFMCSWSPDDRYIAYSKEAGDSVILAEFDLSAHTESPIGD